MEFLGDKIRILRQSKDLTQRQISEEFSLRENSWSQYENNKRTPDVETIKKIAQFFGVSTDYLMGLTDIKYDPSEKEFKDLIGIYNSLTQETRIELVRISKAILNRG